MTLIINEIDLVIIFLWNKGDDGGYDDDIEEDEDDVVVVVVARKGGGAGLMRDQERAALPVI